MVTLCLVLVFLEPSFEVSYALLVMLIVGVWFAIKGIRSVPESGSLKSFVEAPVHSAMSFGTPGISEISRKNSASVVVRVSYAHCIFSIALCVSSILGVLSSKLSCARLSSSVVVFKSFKLNCSEHLMVHTTVPRESRTSALRCQEGIFHSH